MARRTYVGVASGGAAIGCQEKPVFGGELCRWVPAKSIYGILGLLAAASPEMIKKLLVLKVGVLLACPQRLRGEANDRH